MKNRYLLILSCILIVAGCTTPTKELNKPAASLKHYQFSELESLMEKEQRSIAVFLHAEWCKFCRNMEQTTFQNEKVIQLLNEKYYFLSFDGEQKESVLFNKQVFEYKPRGRNTGTHELATALGTIEGTLTYPTFVILNPQYEIVFQHNAFLSAQDMKKILEVEP